MKIVPVVVAIIMACAGRGFAAWLMDVETGIVSAGYNDVCIPGKGGTRFSLTDTLSVESKAFYRVRLTREIAKDSFLSVLYAPLSLSAQGTLPSQVNFNNDVFAAGSPVTAQYRFDSYRLTYWRDFRRSGSFSWKLGFTAKIRDAAVSVSDGARTSEKLNTGFVPLLNFGLTYGFAERYSVILDGDALAGGPGRAEDILLALAYKASGRYSLRLGYRIVEGGADTSEVYNFALLKYLSAGLQVAF